MALLDSIIGAESGGDPYARNPLSSATGAGQFIDSTWLSMIGKYRPDLAEGKSPQEVLALRTDPALSREMVDKYAQENARLLSGAGYEANPGNTYLAHFAGPQGALKVLSADPTMPAAAVLGPAVAKANPFLAKMTAGDLVAWAGRKMGGASTAPPVAPSATGMATAQPVAPIQAIPSMPAPIFSAEAPQPKQAPSSSDFWSSLPLPQEQALQPIIQPPRKPIDLRGLQLALSRPSRVFS